MAAIEGSFLGLAKQSAKGTPNATHADFKYLLVREGAFGVNNISIPLDPEVGGGAFLRSVVKVGANNGGALDVIPRPESLGFPCSTALPARLLPRPSNANLNGIVGPVPCSWAPRLAIPMVSTTPKQRWPVWLILTGNDDLVVTVHGLLADRHRR